MTWNNNAAPSLSGDNLNDAFDEANAYAESVAAGGVELGYAARTSNATQVGAGSADISGLSVTVTVGTRPIIVKLMCYGIGNSAPTGVTGAGIYEGATQYGGAQVAGTAVVAPVAAEARLSPTPGSHTYKAVLSQIVTGTSTFYASTNIPAFIQVIEV